MIGRDYDVPTVMVRAMQADHIHYTLDTHTLQKNKLLI